MIKYKVLLVLSFFLLTEICCSQGITQGITQGISEQHFPPITKNSKPWTYWWWFGSAVDKENITYNLEEFSKNGIGGVHIIPIYGVKGYEDKFISFLSPKWMQMLSYSLRECQRLGLGLDMTLGTGWPFGGPNVKAQFSSSKLVDLRFNINCTSKVNLNLFEEAKKIMTENYELSVFAVNAYSKEGRIDLTNKIDKNGLLNWSSSVDSSKIIALLVASPIQEVKRAAPGGQGNVVDPFSVEALNDYLTCFDKAFENFGEKMPDAFYHDSYEYYGADWTRNFLNEFESRRGYNLLDQMPAFLGMGDIEMTSRVRSDYRYTISQLHESFIKRATKWANEKGVVFRNQAHGAPANILDIYASADIPETEAFGSPKQSIPGKSCDTLFTRQESIDPFILKFASSAAHVTGKNLVSSETGTWLTEHFHETLSKLKPEIDLLFISGINHLYLHGIPYSPKNEIWPGWQFYASSNFGPTNTLWYDISFINSYIARSQAILQSGQPDNELLVYFPIWDLWNSASKDKLISLQMHNPQEWLLKSNFYKTVNKLAANGYSFDYISDEQINNSKVDNGEILTEKSKYKALIIPNLHFMPVRTLKKLLEFVVRGGKVFFSDSLPNGVPGFFQYKEREKEEKGVNERLFEQIKKGSLHLGDDIIAMLRNSLIKGESSFADLNIGFIRRKIEGGKYYFLANQTSQRLNNWVKLDGDYKTVIIYDPFSGNSALAKLKNNFDGSTLVYLQLDPGKSLILKCLYNKVDGGEVWNYLDTSDKGYELKGTWEVEFIQGGPILPESYFTSKLQSWTNFNLKEVSSFSGTARYKIRFQNPRPGTKNWILDLGKVCESARIKINGHAIGSLWASPFNISFGDVLTKGENELQVEVTNSAANRIKDLDERKVNWKKFYDINIVNINYKPFNASEWKLSESGLIGPVLLYPAHSIDE
ncbi:MAG: glycosyl hydrolase [Bacteroidota bacterium]|nr:glycosyl hydrolase [Bacteroidota bacterium]MDP4192002.1 glycosyl hydrolase [Bacteroidota bacterium]MDP4195774.1 glycosyl hydrolase [Bacteroidota bacterium]